MPAYIDTTYFGARPHIRGRRITVACIAYNMRQQNWSVSDLAQQFSLTEAQVWAALLYYRSHEDDIDQQEKNAEHEYRAIKKQYGTG